MTKNMKLEKPKFERLKPLKADSRKGTQILLTCIKTKLLQGGKERYLR